MELRQLQYFVTVVDAGSFSRGAAVLHLAQPSLSRQIALLEDDLGQRLLVRTGRGVTPTEAGDALLVHARAMLDISRRDGTNSGRWMKALGVAWWWGCRRGWRWA